jgi:gamma-glutamyltranspeptidase
MAWLETDSQRNPVEVVGPGKHFFVPVVPTVSVTVQGFPFLALGTSGGYGIPQTTLQVLAYLLFGGDSVQTALRRPRMVSGSLSPLDEPDVEWRLERGFPQDVYRSLGVNAVSEASWEFGNFHAVQFLEDGMVEACADPRGLRSVPDYKPICGGEFDG